MFFDPLYLGMLVVVGLISFLAQRYVKSSFASGQKIQIASGLCGRQVAERILQDAGIDDVTIEMHAGFLSDHYNPMSKTLALSPDVYNGVNCSAAGVAAHEVGHAIQHARGYSLMWFRSLIVPVANIGSNIGPWLVIIGIIMGTAQGAGMGRSLAIAGVVLFAMATVFTLVTVPVEFDASARARDRLVTIGITQRGPEDDAVRKVLMAAGLTYVAAAVASILQLLYWAMRAGLLGNDDD